MPLARRLARPLIALAGAAAAWGAPAAAQGAAADLGDWRSARFSLREGLPSNEIVRFAEARDGRLWAATGGGLAWFDGWIWHAIPDGPTGVPRRIAKRITPYVGDSMLVVMHNLLYVGDTSGFRRIEVKLPEGEQQVLDAVQTFDGLYLLLPFESMPDSARVVRYREGSFERIATPGVLVRRNGPALFATSDGGTWLNTATGLWRLDRTGWRRHLTARGPPLQVTHVADGPDGRGMAHVAAPPSAAGLWDWDARRPPTRHSDEGDNVLLDGVVARDGSMLAVYTGGYVRKRTGGRWGALELQGVEALDARTIHVDRAGDTWVGTGTGLLLLRNSSRLWSGTPQGFPSHRDNIAALATDREGSLWAGTADGIDIFAADGRIRHLSEIDRTPLSLVTALAKDSAGNMWVGSGSFIEGAYRWNGRTWRHFTRTDGLGAGRVHQIRTDRAGRVWFLGIGDEDDVVSGPGAYYLEQGRFHRVGVEEGLPSGRVYDFAEGADGTRWFGTRAGLSRWKAGAWTHWGTRSGTRGGRPFRGVPFRVFSVAIDAAGHPWFGDADESFPYGLGTIDDRDSLVFHTADDGLLSNLIRSVRIGSDGTIWAGTLNGLSAFRNGQWFSFGTERGLGFPQIWPLIVTDSTVTLGTLGGGVRVLRLADARLPAPRVRVTEPAVDGRRAFLQWYPVAWRGSLQSAAIETRYRIDEGPWTHWNTDRSVVLAKLATGAHRIDFQAKGLFVPIDPVAASVIVRIPAPFILRPAFALPVGGLTLALVVLSLVGIRRQRESAATLRESEVRFRGLASSTFEGIAISIDGVIVEANEQLHLMLGAAIDALRGRSIDALLESTSRPRGLVPLGGDLLECQARREDGTRFPAEVRERSLPFFGATARVTVIRDISERERAIQALRASEERFETIFRRSPSPIAMSSWPDGRFVDVSEGFAESTGYTRAEILGRTMSELDLYRDPQQREAVRLALGADGRARGVEFAIRTRDGQVRDVIGSFVQMTLDGKLHVLGVLTDITDRRALEAQLLQSQKMDAIGQLAGGVAHDFNNLLTVITGHADLLRETLVSQEDRSDVDEIRAAAGRASDLTRQLLTFARKQHVKPRRVDLSAVVLRTERMLGRLLGERIVIVTQAAADLPMVKADPGQLEQVLVNLAVNARDAMPTGGRLTIETHAVTLDESYMSAHVDVTPGRYAMIAVTDTGEGIPAAVLPRIFEPFFTTKEVGRGSGLGLAICYGIVREAGGHIAAYSEPGHGTTMRVYLPVHEGAESAPESALAAAPRGGTETVLVVEDEPAVRSLVQRVLTSHGYTVLIAEGLPSALEILDAAATPPALLITDVVLPGPAGPEIARAIRERIPGIAVVYISGYTERAAGHSITLDAPLLPKPFTPTQIAVAARAALDARARRLAGEEPG